MQYINYTGTTIVKHLCECLVTVVNIFSEFYFIFSFIFLQLITKWSYLCRNLFALHSYIYVSHIGRIVWIVESKLRCVCQEFPTWPLFCEDFCRIKILDMFKTFVNCSRPVCDSCMTLRSHANVSRQFKMYTVMEFCKHDRVCPLLLKGKSHIFCSHKREQSRVCKIRVR